MSWILYINSDRMKESLGFSDFYSIVAYENREKHANSTDFNTTWKWKIVIYFGFYQAKSFIVSISDCFASSYYWNKSELIVWNNNKQNMDQLIWFVYEWRRCFFVRFLQVFCQSSRFPSFIAQRLVLFFLRFNFEEEKSIHWICVSAVVVDKWVKCLSLFDETHCSWIAVNALIQKTSQQSHSLHLHRTKSQPHSPIVNLIGWHLSNDR